MSTTTFDRQVEKVRTDVLGIEGELREIEMGVLTEGVTLATLIREGSMVSKQAYNWGDGETACALTAAALSAKARGLI